MGTLKNAKEFGKILLFINSSRNALIVAEPDWSAQQVQTEMDRRIQRIVELRALYPDWTTQQLIDRATEELRTAYAGGLDA